MSAPSSESPSRWRGCARCGRRLRRAGLRLRDGLVPLGRRETSAARRARSAAAGMASAARAREAETPSAGAVSSATAPPSSPATVAVRTASAMTSAKSRCAGHPRQDMIANSRRREPTAALTALATKSAHTMRIRPNRSTLLRSTARSNATATPFLTQSSVRRSAGRPCRPRGRITCRGWVDEPRVRSTSRSWSRLMAAATWRTRSRLTASMPVTPATRIRIALIGAAPRSPVKFSPAKAPSEARLVSSSGGCVG